MKKILYSFIALLSVAFTACVEFEEPVVENYGEGPAIGVAAETADSTITLSLTVDTVNTTYFAYALFEGETPAPDAAQLLKATAGGAAAATLNATKEKWNGKNVKSISFTELMPNTEYHIYAVASSKYGVIGEIADTLVVTTDGLSPYVVEAEQDSTAFYVTFSEEIAVGKGKVNVEFYESWGDFTATTPVAEKDVTVLAEGNVAMIATSNIPAGAYALVSWEVGAFVDAKGNKCNAFTTGLSEEGFDGVWGQMPNTTINVVDSAAVNEGAFTDWEEFVGVIKYSTTIYDMRNDVDETGASLHEVELGSLKVVYTSEGYQATIDVKEWAVRNDSILFVLPMEPSFGMAVDVIVEANAVRDINGNMNVEFASEDAWFRSYNMEIGAVVGKYDITYLSAGREGAEFTETVLITENPAVENGLFISNLLTAGTVIEATFDGDYGIVSVPDEQLLFTNSKGTEYYFVTADGSPALELQVNPADSSMTSLVEMYPFGYYSVAAEKEGWYDYAVSPIVATRSADQDYGMTREMVLGNYTWNYMSAAKKESAFFTVSIEADPESETGVLMKNMLVDGSVVKGDFNTATGELAFEGTQALFVNEANDLLYAFETYDLTHVVFDVAGDGSMKASVSRSPKGMIWGIYVYTASTGEPAGWYDYAVGDVLMQKATAEDAEEEESEDSSEAPAKIRALQNVTLHTEMMPIQNRWSVIEGPARN